MPTSVEDARSTHQCQWNARLSGGKRERYLCPCIVALHVPDATSHILRVVSLDPDTIVSPLGENLHA
jgi:hypothetical protein